MAKALVIYGAKLNIADAEGESVFHYAARLVGNVSPMLEVRIQEALRRVNDFIIKIVASHIVLITNTRYYHFKT